MITCTFEDGGIGYLRHVTVNCIVSKDGRILLGRRANTLLEGGKWNLLGGFVNRDETIAEAAARETAEESGWHIQDPVLFLVNDSPDRPREDRQTVNFVYIATATAQTNQPDAENDLLQWFKLSDLPSENDFAFDHYQSVLLYKKHLAKPFRLPLIGNAIQDNL